MTIALTIAVVAMIFLPVAVCLHYRRRIRDEIVHRHADESNHIRAMLDADAEYARNLAAIGAKAEIEQTRLAEQIEQLRVLYDSATDALVHQATFHGETPESEAATLALYAGHLTGLWQPAKDQGKLLAAGQRIAAFNPTQYAEILDRLRSMQPAINEQ